MGGEALKIGLMVPQNNTTMGAELLAWLSQDTECRTLHVPPQKGLLTLAEECGYPDAPDWPRMGLVIL